MIDQTLYYHFGPRRWLYEWYVDVTEPIRHPLGLQWSNRLRLARWISSYREDIVK